MNPPSSPPPDSPSFNFRDNPSYFDVFSNPETAGFVTAGQALERLNQVAQNVYSMTGVNPGEEARQQQEAAAAAARGAAGKKRKRKSFRELVSNSLGRSRKKKPKSGGGSFQQAKQRTISCGEEADYEQKLASLVRSASLEPPSVSAPFGAQAATSVGQESSAAGATGWFSRAARRASSSKSNSLPTSPTEKVHVYYNQDSLVSAGATGEGRESGSNASAPMPLRSMSMSSAQGGGRRGVGATRKHPTATESSRFHHLPQYTLHKECRRHLLSGQEVEADVVLLHSDGCRVSMDWCDYIKKFFEGVSASSPSAPRTKVITQEVEAFSRHLCEGSELELARAEERTRHARAQVVVVGPDFLRWLERWPNIVAGRVLDQFRVLALLLGVTEEDVGSVHRASLLTFLNWKKLPVVANSQRFAEEMLLDIDRILRNNPPQQKSLRQRRKPPLVVPPSADVARDEKSSGDNGEDKDCSPPYLTALKTRQREVREMEVWPRDVGHGSEEEEEFVLSTRGTSRFPSEASVWCRLERSGSGSPKGGAVGAKKISRAERVNDCCLRVKIPKEAWTEAEVKQEEEERQQECAFIVFSVSAGGGDADDDDVVTFEGRAKISPDLDKRQNPRREKSEREEGPAHLENAVISLSKWAKEQGLEGLVQELSKLPQIGGVDKNISEEKETEMKAMEAKDIPSKEPSPSTTHEKSGGGCFTNAGYIPMARKFSSSSGGKASPASDPTPPPSGLRRSSSASTVSIKPAAATKAPDGRRQRELFSDEMAVAAMAAQADEGSSEMLRMDWAFDLDGSTARPQSRQEIIHGLRKKFPTESSGADSDSEPLQKARKKRRNTTVSSDVQLPTGFVPPALADDERSSPSSSASMAGRAAGTTAQQQQQQQRNNVSSPFGSMFESCQAELIEMQKQFKKELLTLKEVEEKFEEWKTRPEQELAREKRKDELERMRDEWTRVQMLAAARANSESHVWGLLRGIFSRGGGSSASSAGGGGRKKTTSGSSSVLSGGSTSSSSAVAAKRSSVESFTDLSMQGGATAEAPSRTNPTSGLALAALGPPPGPPPPPPPRTWSVTSGPSSSSSTFGVLEQPQQKGGRDLGAVPKGIGGVRVGARPPGEAEEEDSKYDVPRKLSLEQCPEFHFVPVEEAPELVRPVASNARGGNSSAASLRVEVGAGPNGGEEGGVYENVVVKGDRFDWEEFP